MVDEKKNVLQDNTVFTESRCPKCEGRMVDISKTTLKVMGFPEGTKMSSVLLLQGKVDSRIRADTSFGIAIPCAPLQCENCSLIEFYADDDVLNEKTDKKIVGT